MSGSTSSGFDPSIPLRATAPTPANPLTTMGQFVALKNAMNQNALFPGQQQLQQQAITGGGIANQAAQLGLVRAQNTAINGYLGPAVAKGANASIADYTDALARAQAAGYDTSGAIADLHSVGSDPGALATWGKTRLGAGLAPSELLASATPAGAMVNNGQSLQPSQVAPALSATPQAVTPVGTSIDTWPSRDALSGRTVIGYDPTTKAPIYGPLAAVTPPNLAGPAALPPLPFANGGRFPAALRNPNAAPAAATGGVVSGAPGPAQAAALAETGGPSAQAFNAIADQGVQSKTRAAALDNMLGDTSQFKTGPMSDMIAKVRAVAQRFNVPVDADALSSSESFNKLAAQLAAAQSGGTDKSLGNAMAANPHSDLSPQGVDLMLRQLRGNEDYLQARSKLAAAYPNKDDRTGFEASVGSNLDPRVFQYQRMTPEQKGTFLQSTKDPSAFIQSYNWAQKNGLVGSGN